MPDPTQHLIARLASLADATRLRILHLLAGEGLLVSDLADVLQMPQSTVSRHLKQLTEQGWLISKRDGTSHEYRMIEAELDESARQLWKLAREQTAAQPTTAQDRLRLAAVKSQRQRDSRSFFAGAAADWDALRAEWFGNVFVFDGLLALIDPNLVIADLGCGTGTTAEVLAPHVGRVIAIDNSLEMLTAARRRLAGVENVSLEQADFAQLPLADGTVGAATMILSLAYADDPAAALAEAARILKTGGRLIVIDLLPHDRDDFRRSMGQSQRGMATDALTHLATTAGFLGHNVRPLRPDPAAKGPAMFLAIFEKP